MSRKIGTKIFHHSRIPKKAVSPIQFLSEQTYDTNAMSHFSFLANENIPFTIAQ